MIGALLIAMSVSADPVEQLLGSTEETSPLTFTRQFSADGIIVGSLTQSTAASGVPVAAMLDVLRAVAVALEGRDPDDGDRFHIQWEQTFTIENNPIGTGRVLWLELRTRAKGTLQLHRFRAMDGTEQFWLPTGLAATPPRLRQPLDTMILTSGYGLRADPLDQPAVAEPVTAAPTETVEAVKEPPQLKEEDVREINRAYHGFQTRGELGNAAEVGGRNADLDRIMAERRVRARLAEERRLQEEEEAKKAEEKAAERAAAPPPPPPKPRLLFFHSGLDLLANTGTPIRAAADGVVVGARPNGLYGVWIRIDHAGRLTTVYAHLSRIAPGIEPGTQVARGQIVGFIGNSGRSTGSHLHYELLATGRPVDPASHPSTRRDQLTGADLDRLRKSIARSLAQREHARHLEAMEALEAGSPLNPL